MPRTPLLVLATLTIIACGGGDEGNNTTAPPAADPTPLVAGTYDITGTDTGASTEYFSGVLVLEQDATDRATLTGALNVSSLFVAPFATTGSISRGQIGPDSSLTLETNSGVPFTLSGKAAAGELTGQFSFLAAPGTFEGTWVATPRQ